MRQMLLCVLVACSSAIGLSRPLLSAEKATWPQLEVGAKLFTDRDYELTEAPEFLLGREFVLTSIERYEVECQQPGDVYVMTLSKPHSANRTDELQRFGFDRVETPEFQLFPGEVNRVFAWKKSLKKGERLQLRKLAFLVLGEGTDVTLVQPKQETTVERLARIREMEKVADFALETPKLNTSPLPEYGYDQLDYGMTIGIERTPKGRLWACWVAGGDSPEAFFVLATSDDDGAHWSNPRLVVDTHSPELPRLRSTLVGNLWTDPLGR
ncbi:MAG: hypothetical protein KDA69_04715, partial [Planctomycetaceae bacterium]|nr:hypothetical protein [Planctomycetaceae bacterium]